MIDYMPFSTIMGTAALTVNLLTRLIERIHKHIHADQKTLPMWLEDLTSELKEYSEEAGNDDM